MVKLRQSPIQELDLEEYVENYSDFSFELRVLSLLHSLRYSCLHGGVYEDPVTEKTREFDIRATRKLGHMRVRLAVECKNIRNNFPIVIHGMQRRREESYYDLLICQMKESRSPLFSANNESPDPGKVIRIQPALNIYPPGQLVGKHPDQVGRHSVEKTIITGDGEVFEKMSQALHSAYDLIHESLFESDDGHDKVSVIIPIFVVPDSMLWVVPYDDKGDRVGKPYLIDKLSLFVGKTWKIGSVVNYTLSHLEIIQFSKLESWLNATFDDDVNWDSVFIRSIEK